MFVCVRNYFIRNLKVNVKFSCVDVKKKRKEESIMVLSIKLSNKCFDIAMQVRSKEVFVSKDN